MNKNLNHTDNITAEELPGADTAGAPIAEPGSGAAIPSEDGGEPYAPRHLADGGRREDEIGMPGGDYIPQPDGSHIAPNGAVIRDPQSGRHEIKPDYAYTDEQQDYDLLIM